LLREKGTGERIHSVPEWSTMSWMCTAQWNNSQGELLLTSKFRRVLNVVLFSLGDSLASEFYVPIFRNTLFHLLRWCKLFTPNMKMEKSAPKRRHIKFRCRGIIQKKDYNN